MPSIGILGGKSIGQISNRVAGRVGAPILRKRRPVASSIKQWIESHGQGGYERLHDGATYKRKPPRTPTAKVHPSFERRLSYSSPEQFIAEIPGARVVGTNGVVVAPTGEYFVESSWEEYWLVRDNAYRLPRLPRRQSREGAYTSLISLWWENSYFHWMCDAMPRVAAISSLPADVKVLIPARLTSYQRQALDLLGLAGDRLVPFDDENVCFERFYFISAVGRTGNIPPWAAEWLRDRFRAAVPGEGRQPRRIYISRNLAAARRVLNEDDVMGVLAPLGFEKVFCEELTLADQVRLFSGAETVVAPHGAGNTNMLYAPPGARLIEFQEPGLVHVCYWSLCESLGHEYWYLMAEPAAESKRGADMVAPIDQLRAVLERTLGSGAGRVIS